ncbi:MAG: phosphatidylglycerophosphatase A [Firmicutes bacterium]|nr:phosphatidylglycerophosphatase A [Bacillota bacterium]
MKTKLLSLKTEAIALLQSRGVSLDEIVDCVYFLQQEYHQNLDKKILMESVLSVLDKREVQFALMTAIELDIMTEKKRFENKKLEAVIARDEGLFGTDEVLAYGICNLYGSIALTNFGFIDKQKFGVVARLNEEGKKGIKCHTFLDDMVGAIAAAAASRFAHSL